MYRKFKTDLIERGSIAVAIIFTGVMAGFFWTYSYNVNLAMLGVDGKTYATMQSLFNQNVRHFTFFLFFFGTGVATCLAAFLNFSRRNSASFRVIAIAAVIYIAGIIVFTKQVNLPLNYYTESWNPVSLPVDWQQTRELWNNANDIRVFVSMTTFSLCTMALALKRERSS